MKTPFVEIDWEKQGHNHNIVIPNHNHVITEDAYNLATLLVEYRNKKKMNFFKRFLKRIGV